MKSKDREGRKPEPSSQKDALPARQKSKHALLGWNELEEWQKDNHYILHSYRASTGSYAGSFASWLYLHNESVNIYSHLLGALLFFLACPAFYYLLRPRYEQASWEDVYVFSCFFAGAVGCLGMSATYHTIANHSHEIAVWGNKLDYLGIVLLIWGSFVPSIHYGFACHPQLRTTYWAMISTIGAGCAVTSTSSKFRTPAWRPFRAGMFVAMGLSAVVPVIHGLTIYSLERMILYIGLPWLSLQGILYIVGAALYASRIPERFSPGTFDVWGSSHQIFHVLVVLAAVSHLTGLLIAFDYYHSNDALARCI